MFVYEQMSITTAEDERRYFTGESEAEVRANPNIGLPPGTYRIIGGNLYRVVGGAPPGFPIGGAL